MKKYLILMAFIIITALILSGSAFATTKVTVNKTGGKTNDHSFSSSVSSDGRYVAFSSSATNLVSGDTNKLTDIFVRDTITKKTERVSFKKNKNQITGSDDEDGCFEARISSNGRYVTYSSKSDLGFGTPAYKSQIYFFDRYTKTTELISKSTSNNAGNSHSYVPSVSSNGKYVVYQSDAANLVDSDSNDNTDIFLRDRVSRTTKRINLGSSQQQAIGGDSYSPVISADGKYVAFSSGATNLVAGDTNLCKDIFVRNLATKTNKRIMGKKIVSGKLQVTQTNDNSDFPSISSNGRYVAFESYASNLVFKDTNGASDIFVADMFHIVPIISRVSVSTTERQANGDSASASISGDGRYIAFYSWSSNLVSKDTNGMWDVFVRDKVAGKTKRPSVSNKQVQGNSGSYYPFISTNGKYVVFESGASNLVSKDTNNRYDIFMSIVDFRSPYVKAISPKNKAKKIKSSKTITIAFNEYIKIYNKTRIVLKTSSGKLVAVSKYVRGKKLYINPKKRLNKKTRYIIYIYRKSISDFTDDPNYNTKKYVYQFTTGTK